MLKGNKFVVSPNPPRVGHLAYGPTDRTEEQHIFYPFLYNQWVGGTATIHVLFLKAKQMQLLPTYQHPQFNTPLHSMMTYQNW